MNRTDYLAFIRETLIPDLRESGMTATAFDFETLLAFMEQDARRIAELENVCSVLCSASATPMDKRRYPYLEACRANVNAILTP